MTAVPGGAQGPGEIAPGLYLVSTPIGAARDITLRALDLLQGADLLAAEDTRRLRQLMEIHGISLAGRKVLACHDHNEAAVAPRILAALAAGQVVAYASDAGTPLISDPGFALVRAATEAGHAVHAAPGASAVLAALAVAGLPTDRFLFAGFAPAAAGDRGRFLDGLAEIEATVVLYESPRRVARTLQDMIPRFGPARRAALCRELTKRHEEVLRGPLSDLSLAIEGTDLKGEIVLVVDRAIAREADPATIATALESALQRLSVKDAVALVAHDLKVARRVVYKMALEMGAG